MSRKKVNTKEKKLEKKEYRGVEILVAPRGRSKYGNRRSYVDGNSFHSFDEACFYVEVSQNPKIEHLVLQPRFELYTQSGHMLTRYIPDFQFAIRKMQIIVDVKGSLTDVYKLKRDWLAQDYVLQHKNVVFYEAYKHRSKLGFKFVKVAGQDSKSVEKALEATQKAG